MNESVIASTDVEIEIQRRQTAALAAKELTRGMLRTGWAVVIAGYFLPILPIIGLFLMVVTGIIGCFVGVLVLTKGNTGGGVKLILGAWLGTGAAALAWILIYAVIASLGTH